MKKNDWKIMNRLLEVVIDHQRTMEENTKKVTFCQTEVEALKKFRLEQTVANTGVLSTVDNLSKKVKKTSDDFWNFVENDF